jgi:hypothetical protein
MRFLRILLLALIAGSWCAPEACADWMVGGYLGHLWTQTSRVTLTLPTQQTQVDIADVQYRGESFDSPQYYGYRVTWTPTAHRWLGIEGEFIHAKVFAETSEAVHVRGSLRGRPVDTSLPLSSVVQRLAMSHGLNFVFVNLAVRRTLNHPAPSGRGIVGVLRVGVGPTFPHAESTIDGVDQEQYESGGVGAQVTGGLEIGLWRGLGLQGEYKYTWASPEIDVVGGTATVPSRSHHVVAGLTYRF